MHDFVDYASDPIVTPNEIDVADVLTMECCLYVSALFLEQLAHSSLSSNSFELRSNQFLKLLTVETRRLLGALF